MSDKFRQIENILFAVFLAEYQIVFYLVKYPSFSDYDIQRAAFYFLLILTALFAILFAFFCCYDFFFTHPLFIKRAFMLFTVAFLPFFTKYVADNYYYAFYIKPLIIGIGAFYLFYYLIPLVAKKQKYKYQNTKEDYAFYLIIFTFPLAYFLYKLPFYYYTSLLTCTFYYALSIFCFFIWLHIFISNCRCLIPHFLLIQRLFICFCYFFIPLFTFYVNYNLLYERYLFIFTIFMFIPILLLNFFNKHLPRNAEGFFIHKSPQANDTNNNENN